MGHRYDDNGKYDTRHISSSSFLIPFENDPDSRIHCIVVQYSTIEEKPYFANRFFLLLNVGNKMENPIITAHVGFP